MQDCKDSSARPAAGPSLIPDETKQNNVAPERELRGGALRCLVECDLERKAAITREFCAARRRGEVPVERNSDRSGVSISVAPGLPADLALTAPTKVRRRGLGSDAGRIAFLHALAHIEWNAINLAWDAVWRFGGMPEAFYDDWTRVADEEASHFELLRTRLRELGSDYGRLPAHGGLWQMAEETADDVLARMALVPRVLEARGLDVTPALLERLRALGDERSVAALEVILHEEVGHVAIGTRWFRYVCEQRGLEPRAAFANAIRARFRGRVKGPFAVELRRLAGFDDDELEMLRQMETED